MKNTLLALIALLMTLPLQAQDITNKLGGNTVNETYDVTDSGDNLLFRVQGDGNVGIGVTNPSYKLHIIQNSTDRAGFISIDNVSNANEALYVESNGSGPVIKSYTTGTGSAGVFQIDNASNGVSAIYATTSGVGSAIYADGKITIRDGSQGVGKVLTSDANGLATWQPGGGYYNAYVKVSDRKPEGTDGGTFTAGPYVPSGSGGIWQARDINTEDSDPQNIASIGGNGFITLPAGTYRCIIICPAYQVGQHQAKLQNITGSTTLLFGTTQYAMVEEYIVTNSIIVGQFTLTTSSIVEIQHIATLTKANDGFGTGAEWTGYGFGESVFTVAEFWREN